MLKNNDLLDFLAQFKAAVTDTDTPARGGKTDGIIGVVVEADEAVSLTFGEATWGEMCRQMARLAAEGGR